MRLVLTRRRLFSGILTLAMIGSLLVLSAVPAGAISVSPSLDFGKVRVGATKTLVQTVTLSSGFGFVGGTVGFSDPTGVFVRSFGTCTGATGPGTCTVNAEMTLLGVGIVTHPASLTECPVGGGGCSNAFDIITAEGVANAAPVCQNVATSTVKNRATDLNLDCTDADPITYAVITSPQHGSVTLTPGTGAVNYVPDFGYTGPDSFTYQADDGVAYPASNVSMASITVEPREDQPSPTPIERFQLTLSTIGEGKIVSDPAGINCGHDCTGDFEDGSEVTLTAKARAGWEFKRWRSWRYGCRGQGEVCTIEISKDRKAIAVFVRPPIVGGDRNRP